MPKQLSWLCTAVFILGPYCGCLAADDTPADPAHTDQTARIQALIHALSADKFSERLGARRELFRIGRPAIEALEFAAKADDSETRIAATELLLALRGRGFMGINLQEEQPSAELDDDTPSDAKPVPPPVVKVVGIANGRGMGSGKPFPAETAGMSTGDTVLEINGKPIHGVKDLMREVIYIGPNRVALVLVERDGKKLRLPLVLTRNPLLGDVPPVDLESEPLPHVSAKKTAPAQAPATAEAEAAKDKDEGNAAAKK